jgi:hypothetical protein
VKSLRSPFVEGEGRGTTLPNPQGPDECIFKGPGSIPESYDGMIDLLLVLNFEVSAAKTISMSFAIS